MFNRVLIMSASAGNGHVRAAEALEQAFRDLGAAREVRHIDALAYASPFVRRLYRNAYLDLVNKSPSLLGILYDAADKPWWEERKRLAFHQLNTWPLIRYINKYKPDLIVCTHFLPADIVSFLICKQRLTSRHAVVITDFDLHGMWLTRHCDKYFTALDEAREHLIRLGAAPSKVAVTGIPIDPVFANLPDKEETRRTLGLDPDRTTIIVSAGGFGVGRVTELIEQLVQIDKPVQILAMCGKNTQLKQSLEEQYASTRSNRDELSPLVVPVGYTTKMHEYMAASDLMVGKPGGLTTSEALASSLVMVIVNPIPGQEERNADHLLEEGAAIRCNNLPALTYKVNKLLSNPERFVEMQTNARRLGHPQAARDIVTRLLSEYAERPADSRDSFESPHHCTTRLQRVLRARRVLPVVAPGKFNLFGEAAEEAG